jgi:hypothetical protein
MRKGFLIVLLSVLMSSTVFGDEAFERLMNAKSLKCEYGSGAVAVWESSKVKVEKDNFDASIVFDSIDLTTGKARMIGEIGAVDVIVFATGAGLTFIEETGVGNLHITTVFASYAKGTTDFIVVTSRHLMFISKPLPSQYHGTCKVWE